MKYYEKAELSGLMTVNQRRCSQPESRVLFSSYAAITSSIFLYMRIRVPVFP